jgi:hypothetical protein
MTETEIAAALDLALPGKAFLKLAPQGTPDPFLVFTCIWYGPLNDICGYANADQLRYQVDSYARSHKQAKANMDAAINSLRACPDPPLVEMGAHLYEQDTKLHRATINITTWHHVQGAS